MIVTPKVVRQKLMQAAVLAKIDREGLRIDTDQVRERLRVTRAHVSRAPYLTDMLDRWEEIVEGNDIDAARAVAVLEGETGNEMRNLSPLGVLLSETERLQVLDELREQWPLPR